MNPTLDTAHIIDNFSEEKNTTVLDLGCGTGTLVKELLDKGYHAYGCDFIDCPGCSDFDSETMHKFDPGVLRAIKMDIYQLPFKDNEFDFVVSSQVFEHIMNYEATLKEIHRVLKPGGISLNTFPAKYIFIEPHVLVPLASIIKNKWWLLLWAYLGIRNQFQKGKSAQEVAELNYRYLRAHTNYLTQAEIRQCANFFSDIKFNDDVFALREDTRIFLQSGAMPPEKVAFARLRRILSSHVWIKIKKIYINYHSRVLYLKK